MRRYICKYCGRPTKLTALSRHLRRRGHWLMAIGVAVMAYNIPVNGLVTFGTLAGLACLCYGAYLSWMKKPSWVCEFCGVVFRAYASQGGQLRTGADPLSERYAEYQRDPGTGMTQHTNRDDVNGSRTTDEAD